MEEERNEIIPVESTALREITAAEVDMQITTAKRYPRNLEKVKKRALSMAITDKEIARSCFYVLRRGAKNIEGPGVRLAEIIASQWGNLRVTSRVVEVGATVVRAQGIAHDLETNVAYSNEVSVRITDKYGKRYSDDMIVVSGNAACSKALRNVIFKAVPFAYVKPIYEAAKKTAVGDKSTLNDSKERCLEKFKGIGVKKEQLVGYLDVNSWEDVGVYELEALLGTFTSIEDGSSTIAELFNKKPKEAPKQAENASEKGSKPEPVKGNKGGTVPKEDKPKARRGRPKKEKAEQKPAEQPADPGPTEPPPEEALPPNGNGAAAPNYNQFRQKYNLIKAKLMLKMEDQATNDFIFAEMKKTGKDLSQFTEDEWSNLIAAMEGKLAAIS